MNDEVFERGVKIGSPITRFGGLAPVAKKLHEAISEVADLEKDRYELGNIRATLLLNFGPRANNRYGITIQGYNNDSTHQMLMQVLTHLVENGVGSNNPTTSKGNQ